MILIHFPNTESKRSALAQLAGRFSFKTWASGEMLVPEDALAYLAVRGISFTVEGVDLAKCAKTAGESGGNTAPR